ncbi:hypothetical protein [Methanococcus maripaludis]|uniref:Uncharacterized protein n=2 Tax=Methanococcus maripaludis TaxID=39152 RepID=A0A7J9PD40_METMI|nr:hypothetical protein [Methanococcus maripaludis]MBA2861163.1 hypothetical protein [Methanococcus maripaludis]
MNKIVLILSLVLISSFCLCTDKTDSGSEDLSEFSSTIVLQFGETTVNVPLRAPINDSMTTTLINTNDSEIKSDYTSGNYKIMYFEYDFNLSNEEGGIVLTDLVSKVSFFTTAYPYVIADQTLFNNTEDIAKVKNSNQTLVIQIERSNSSATIEKYNNTYVIEGNSLNELDKAESRFVIAMLS